MKERSYLPYGKQIIDDDDIAAVTAALKSDFLTTGPTVELFEKSFSKVVDAQETIVCGNATQALHLACIVLGLKPDEYAIVPSLTFLATANAVRYTGANVIFSDVSPDTGLMTPENFLEAIEYCKSKGIKPKVVLPVHLAGQTVDQEKIREIATQNNMTVLTDSCHALGSNYKGAKAGSCTYEDLAVFSFHPVKTIAMGEGGAITTNNPEIAARLRTLRSHGMIHRPEYPNIPNMGLDENGSPNPWYYEMRELGYNYRESDIHCALGVSQLRKLDFMISRRRELVALYDALLKPLSPRIQSPQRAIDCEPGWHLYAARIDFEGLGISRSKFMGALKQKNIGTQVHYMPVHQQPYYRALSDRILPGADEYYKRTLSLPLYPSMEDDDVHYVVDSISEIIGLS